MGHTLRGAVTAWLALIALQAIVANGSGKVAGALAGIEHLVTRALDPNVPAIPDHGHAAATELTPTGPGQQAYSSLPRPGMAGIN